MRQLLWMLMVSMAMTVFTGCEDSDTTDPPKYCEGTVCENSWEECSDTAKACVVKDGMCNADADCADMADNKTKCEMTSHKCYDPSTFDCATDCADPYECNDAKDACQLKDGMCNSDDDCKDRTDGKTSCDDKNTCVEPVVQCTENATRCSDDRTKVETCDADGNWNETTTCEAPQTCSVTDDAASCAADKCADVTCGDNSTCNADTGACDCDAGFVKDGDNCVAEDKCANVTCGDNSTCDAADGTCKCDEGFVKDGDNCVAEDKCANVTCGDNSTCDAADGTCKCDEGYVKDGDNCVADTTCTDGDKRCNEAGQLETCASNAWTAEDCAEGFSCIAQGDTFACVDDNADRCEGVTCGDNSTCNADTGACDCDADFHKEADACVANTKMVDCTAPATLPANGVSITAQVEVTWTNDAWTDAATCDWGCEAGFTKNTETNTCDDGYTDPCAAADACGDNEDCSDVNTDGVAECTCKDGYVSVNDACVAFVCEDGAFQCDGLNIQSCANNAWTTAATCDANQTCEAGQDGSVKCVDVDLCADVNCGTNSTCDAADGTCKCDEGYVLDGENCVEANLCDGVVCGENSTCDPADGACKCDSGYVLDGETCVAQTCTGLSFDAIELDPEYNSIMVGVDGDNELSLEFYASTPADTYDLASSGVNDNYETCNQCAVVRNSAGAEAKYFFQSSGSLTVTAGDAESGESAGSVASVTLVEVTIKDGTDDGIWTSTPVEGGDCLEIETAAWDTMPPQCEAGTTRCADSVVETCQADGSWTAGTDCAASNQACMEGTCMNPGECVGISFDNIAVNPDASYKMISLSGDAELSLEFFENTPAGSYNLASEGVNDNYATCMQCALIRNAAASKIYYTESGSLSITDGDPYTGESVGSIATVKLVEVTIESGTFTSTPVENGGCYEIQTAAWDTRVPCTEGDVRCSGTTVQTCDADGYTWVNTTDCSADGNVCSEGACVEPTPCTTDDDCTDEAAPTCNSVTNVCMATPMTCDDPNVDCGEGGTCEMFFGILPMCTCPEGSSTTDDWVHCAVDPCEPGAVMCSGNTVKTCNATGDGWDVTTDCAASNQLCSAGACVDATACATSDDCTDANFPVCDYVSSTCRADATSCDDTNVDCGNGTCELDNSGYAYCDCPFGEYTTGDYTHCAANACDDADHSNDDWATATAMTMSEIDVLLYEATGSGHLCSSETNFFSFDLVAGDDVTVTLASANDNLSVYLVEVDADLNVLDYRNVSEKDGSGNYVISGYAAPESKAYYIAIFTSGATNDAFNLSVIAARQCTGDDDCTDASASFCDLDTISPNYGKCVAEVFTPECTDDWDCTEVVDGVKEVCNLVTGDNFRSCVLPMAEADKSCTENADCDEICNVVSYTCEPWATDCSETACGAGTCIPDPQYDGYVVCDCPEGTYLSADEKHCLWSECTDDGGTNNDVASATPIATLNGFAGAGHLCSGEMEYYVVTQSLNIGDTFTLTLDNPDLTAFFGVAVDGEYQGYVNISENGVLSGEVIDLTEYGITDPTWMILVGGPAPINDDYTFTIAQ